MKQPIIMSKRTRVMGIFYLVAGSILPGINIIENQSIIDPYFVEKFNAGMVN
jgi:hypothetical protein